jgi:hypothetical protein
LRGSSRSFLDNPLNRAGEFAGNELEDLVVGVVDRFGSRESLVDVVTDGLFQQAAGDVRGGDRTGWSCRFLAGAGARP